MRGDRADYNDFPNIRFTNNATSNIVLAGNPGYLLNGTFASLLMHYTSLLMLEPIAENAVTSTYEEYEFSIHSIGVYRNPTHMMNCIPFSNW